MTAPIPVDQSQAVVVELANLRGSFDRFARDLGEVKTSVAVLVERNNRSDADLERVRTEAARELGETREEVRDLRTDVESLKRWRWTVTGAAAAVGAAAGYAVQFLAR